MPGCRKMQNGASLRCSWKGSIAKGYGTLRSVHACVCGVGSGAIACSCAALTVLVSAGSVPSIITSASAIANTFLFNFQFHLFFNIGTHTRVCVVCVP